MASVATAVRASRCRLHACATAGGDAVRDDAGDQANAPTPISQATRAPRWARSASAVGEERQEQARRRAVVGRRAARADVAPLGDPRRREQQRDRRQGGEEQHGRPRTGERAQLLGPAERGRPAQPARADGGVGDHPQRATRRRARRPRCRVRQAPRRGDLAASAPTPTKTGSGETSASARNAEPAPAARPARMPTSRASHSDHRPERRSPASDAANDRGAARRRRRGRAPGGRRPPPCAARGPRRAAPTRREHAAGAAEPPRHVAADGQQIVRHAVEEPQRAVVTERARELRARSASVG